MNASWEGTGRLRAAGPRISVSVSWLFRDVDLERRFVRARDAGFEGVEIQLVAEAPLPAVRRAAANSGLPVVLINIGSSDFANGGPGLSGAPGREDAFAAAAADAAEAAQQLSAQWVNLGPSRALPGVSRAHCADVLAANAAIAVDRLQGSGARLLIEPFNALDAPGSVVVTHQEALDLVGRSGAAGLIFDAYHSARADGDIAAAFLGCSHAVRHVQFADCPGRGPPGTGEADLQQFFRTVLASEYVGWIGAEYAPGNSTEPTLSWLDPLKRLRCAINKPAAM